MNTVKHITTVLLFFIAISVTAQQGINYKALIKDGSGNVLASSPVSIQFIIYEGAALTNNVYQESHTINTDANGMVIVNIGEGTTSDIFTDIDWGSDDHYLNVQINTGGGLTDMGTTQFKAVPFAKSALTAENVKGLEAIDEGNGIGWRLVGQNPDYYGNIGNSAVDLSTSLNLTRGAIGNNSTALGFATTALGIHSSAIGRNTTASGFASMAMGWDTTASGWSSTAMGFSTRAESLRSTAIGSYNVGGGLINSWEPTDPLLEIGNGDSDASRSNALTVLKNGNVGIDTPNPSVKLQITGGSDAGLNQTGGYIVTGETTDIHMVIDNNEIMVKQNSVGQTLYLNNGGGDVSVGGNTDVNGVLRAQKNVWPATGAGVEIAYNASLGIGYVQAYDRNTAIWKDLALGALNVTPVSNNFTSLGTSTKKWTAVYATNGTIQTSDRRMKKEINNIKYGLNTVMKLHPVSYKWKKGNQDVNLGLIAQEVQKLIPEVIDVGDDENKTLGMKYTELIPVLISAIQEQQKIINSQNNKINTLTTELTELKSLDNRVKQLEALINTTQQ